MSTEIVIALDHVIVFGQLVRRPPSVTRGQWQAWWDKVQRRSKLGQLDLRTEEA